MANTGVDGELMQQGMEMAVARNGGKRGQCCQCSVNANSVNHGTGNPLPPHPKVSLQQGCASAVLVSLDTSLKGKTLRLKTFRVYA